MNDQDRQTDLFSKEARPGRPSRSEVAATEVVRFHGHETPAAPDFVVARPGAAEPQFQSRWTPRHVWTLHLVPGCLDGPPLAVRRRVLSDEQETLDMETPTGTMGVYERRLSSIGEALTYGSSRHDEKCDPPIADQWWGCDLAIWIYDHCPTSEERAEWLARRRVEQAALKSPPGFVWLQKAGRCLGAPDVVEKCPLYRDGYAETARSDWAYWSSDWGDRATARSWPHNSINLLELAVKGRDRDVHLNRPSDEQLAADGRERARKAAEQEKLRDDFHSMFGIAPAPEAEGTQACRDLGLDPETATVAEVDAAFRYRVKATHPDHGGDANADMARLVELRDQARAHVGGRA